MSEIHPKFKLKQNKEAGPTLILMYVYFNKQRLVYSTGMKILPTLWDEKTSNPTTDSKIINAQSDSPKNVRPLLGDINTILRRYMEATERAYSYMIRQDLEITKEVLKGLLDQELKKEITKKKKLIPSLNEFISVYIEEIEKGIRLTSGGEKFRKGTIKNYKGFKVQFLEYQEKRKRKFNYQHITMDFYDDFIEYFYSKNYSINTVGRHIKTIKVIMRASRDLGYHENVEIENTKFRTLRYDPDTIYLTEDELDRIYRLDLSDHEHLDQARDVFIVGCRIAQRYSDYSVLSKDNIVIRQDGKQLIELVQIKTNERVSIPIHWQVLAIMKKYNGTLPKTHEQKVNKYIKVVGKLAEIDEPVFVEEARGGMRIKAKKPKYNLIQTHTARRTGATLMYKAGIPSIDIMKITGHTTENRFLKYIRLGKEETAILLTNHQYFQKSS